MGTTSTGTQVPPLVAGLSRYLDDRLAGVVPFKMDAMWGGTWNTTHWRTKPGLVADSTVPTWQFIYQRLHTGREVRIALDGRSADGTRNEGQCLQATAEPAARHVEQCDARPAMRTVQPGLRVAAQWQVVRKTGTRG